MCKQEMVKARKNKTEGWHSEIKRMPTMQVGSNWYRHLCGPRHLRNHCTGMKQNVILICQQKGITTKHLPSQGPWSPARIGWKIREFSVPGLSYVRWNVMRSNNKLRAHIKNCLGQPIYEASDPACNAVCLQLVTRANLTTITAAIAEGAAKNCRKNVNLPIGWLKRKENTAKSQIHIVVPRWKKCTNYS